MLPLCPPPTPNRRRRHIPLRTPLSSKLDSLGTDSHASPPSVDNQFSFLKSPPRVRELWAPALILASGKKSRDPREYCRPLLWPRQEKLGLTSKALETYQNKATDTSKVQTAAPLLFSLAAADFNIEKQNDNLFCIECQECHIIAHIQIFISQWSTIDDPTKKQLLYRGTCSPLVTAALWVFTFMLRLSFCLTSTCLEGHKNKVVPEECLKPRRGTSALHDIAVGLFPSASC